MVARRAHNPEAVWFKSHLRNQKENQPFGLVFFLLRRGFWGGLELKLLQILYDFDIIKT